MSSRAPVLKRLGRKRLKPMRLTISGIISHLRKSPLDAWYYIQGSGRTMLYESKHFKWMVRKHIRDQFEFRCIAANECLVAGECKCCGCSTPSLFFADKPCSVSKDPYCQNQKMKVCYPEMKSKSEWNKK